MLGCRDGSYGGGLTDRTQQQWTQSRMSAKTSSRRARRSVGANPSCYPAYNVHLPHKMMLFSVHLSCDVRDGIRRVSDEALSRHPVLFLSPTHLGAAAHTLTDSAPTQAQHIRFGGDPTTALRSLARQGSLSLISRTSHIHKYTGHIPFSFILAHNAQRLSTAEHFRSIRLWPHRMGASRCGMR
jgi:hypothetical protein